MLFDQRRICAHARAHVVVTDSTLNQFKGRSTCNRQTRVHTPRHLCSIDKIRQLVRTYSAHACFPIDQRRIHGEMSQDWKTERTRSLWCLRCVSLKHPEKQSRVSLSTKASYARHWEGFSKFGKIHFSIFTVEILSSTRSLAMTCTWAKKGGEFLMALI